MTGFIILSLFLLGMVSFRAAYRAFGEYRVVRRSRKHVQGNLRICMQGDERRLLITALLYGAASFTLYFLAGYLFGFEGVL